MRYEILFADTCDSSSRLTIETKSQYTQHTSIYTADQKAHITKNASKCSPPFFALVSLFYRRGFHSTWWSPDPDVHVSSCSKHWGLPGFDDSHAAPAPRSRHRRPHYFDLDSKLCRLYLISVSTNIQQTSYGLSCLR